MKRACIDASMLVAIAFRQRGWSRAAKRLDGFAELFAADLLKAELRSAFLRERVAADASLLEPLSWIIPDRPLDAEVERVLAAGYLRGADCWHLACALYLARDPGELGFLTLDDRQRAVAAELGFVTM